MLEGKNLGNAMSFGACSLTALTWQSLLPRTAAAQRLCLGNPGAKPLLGVRHRLHSQEGLAAPRASPDLLPGWARPPAPLPRALQASRPRY